MPSRNDAARIDQLLNILFTAAANKAELKVSIPQNSIIRLTLNGQVFDFEIDFDENANVWFVEK